MTGYTSMTKIKQTVKKTTTTRVRKDANFNESEYQQCNCCHGTGLIRRGYNKKKK